MLCLGAALIAAQLATQFKLKKREASSCPSLQVAQLSKAMSDVPLGGQILIDSATFNSVTSNIAGLGKLLASRPDFESLNKHVRHR